MTSDTIIYWCANSCIPVIDCFPTDANSRSMNPQKRTTDPTVATQAFARLSSASLAATWHTQSHNNIGTYNHLQRRRWLWSLSCGSLGPWNRTDPGVDSGAVDARGREDPCDQWTPPLCPPAVSVRPVASARGRRNPAPFSAVCPRRTSTLEGARSLSRLPPRCGEAGLSETDGVFRGAGKW